MLRFFRSSNSVVVITILLIGVLTWAHVLFGEYGINSSDKYSAFAFQTLSGWFAANGLLPWFGLVFFLLAAILLTYANSRLRLIDKNSFLPALCYILLIGGIPEIHQFNPVVIATILLVAGFVFLVRSFESDRLSYMYFIVPIFISAATFFYQYMYVYMLVVWFAIALWRPGYWREWAFSILGFALPLFFMFSWFVLVEDDYSRVGVFYSEILTLQRVSPSFSIPTIVFSALGVAVTVISFGYMMRHVGSKKIIIRNGYYILILTAVITIALISAVPDMIPFAWYLLAFPMSFVISNYLATVKSMRWGNVVLIVLFVGVIVAQAIYFSTE